MAYLSNAKTVPAGAIDSVDTVAKYPVLTVMSDSAGNQFVYLQGVASTAAGTWVTYDELGVTTRLAANAIGPVAIAQAATVASTYGWYLIFGSSQANVSTGFADNGNLYATATAGEADDAVVAGDRIKNAIGRSAISGGKALCQVWYPVMDDGLAA